MIVIADYRVVDFLSDCRRPPGKRCARESNQLGGTQAVGRVGWNLDQFLSFSQSDTALGSLPVVQFLVHTTPGLESQGLPHVWVC